MDVYMNMNEQIYIYMCVCVCVYVDTSPPKPCTRVVIIETSGGWVQKSTGKPWESSHRCWSRGGSNV